MSEEIKIEREKTPKTTSNKPVLDVTHREGKRKYYKPKKKKVVESPTLVVENEIRQAKMKDFTKKYQKDIKPDYLKDMPNQKLHKNVSFFKSGVRIIACVCGLGGKFELAFTLLGVAEIVGIYEEMV